MSCGGLSEKKAADEEIQEICEKVKAAAEDKAEIKFSKFEAKYYRSQVVAGMNYFIKVYVGDSYVHLRVYQSLPHDGSTLELIAIQTGKSEDDPIVYF